MQMLPIIADTSFNRLGVIDTFVSFIWSSRYYAVGDFELTVAATPVTVAILKKDYYVLRDDSEEAGIIERIRITESADGKQLITASGRFLSSILGRRIIAVQTQVSGTVEACVKKLINENVINPSISARRIPNFTFGTFTNAPLTMEQQFTGKNLLEAVSSICETFNCGFRTTLQNGVFVFSLYDGVDRSYNQAVNPYVVFSNDYDNLDSSEYAEDYQGIVTDVLVAGEGEGLERKTVWAKKNNTSGLGRYEAYQDARNSSTNNGEISEAVYYAQLREEGLESITAFSRAFAGAVNWNNYGIGKDISVGDICVIENTHWGIAMNARIIEIVESVNEAGVYSAIPTFAPAPVESEADNNAYLLTESGLTLMSDNAVDALILETASFEPRTSEYDSAKRISELDIASVIDSGDYFALATGGTTKKLDYATLQADMLDYDKLSNKPRIEGVTLQYDKTFGALGLNALTNSEIENLLS